MIQALYTGVSGVQSSQFGLDVTSDNLANTGSTGFKSLNTEFANLFANTLASVGNKPVFSEIGNGARLQATATQMQEGAILSSDRFNDLALTGDGWFGVRSGTQTLYTRAGNFVFDEFQKTAGQPNSTLARLTTTDGKYVAGTMLSNFTYNGGFDYEDGTNSGAYVISQPAFDVPLAPVGAQGPLELPTRLAYPVTPTSKSDFFGNLAIQSGPQAISAEVISATGATNHLKIAFSLSATQPSSGTSWDTITTVTSTDGTITYDTQNGQALFGPTGLFQGFTTPTANNDGTPVTLNLDRLISVENTQASGSSTSDGIKAGTLVQYGIRDDGTVIADFSNGRQSAIGKLAVYHFQNDQGLQRISGTLFEQSNNSGEAHFWTNDQGESVNGTSMRSHSLEASNVRFDVGLTDMIILQRALQSSAKVITTADEMIQKALQMRR